MHMRRFIIAAALVVLASPSHADKSLKVKVDDTKNTLTWRGNVYKIKPEESCAKFGWRAERPGQAFNFCTATQGYANFQEGDKTIQCDQDR